jgi:PAS domain S-box-containing protein
LVVTISVLYVDDEEAFLELGKRYLEQTHEFTVTPAQSAAVALDLLKSNGIQAIVSDYQMPVMDGIAFLKQVRATDKHIPFIIFTGRGWEAVAVEAFENGADFYLQKGNAEPPRSTYANLMHKIKLAIEHRKADAEVITLSRLYSVLSATNKAIVRVHDKNELLNEICRIVVETGGFTMAWAGIANPKTHNIEPVGSSGHIEGYLDTIAISTDDSARGKGPTGTAFRTRAYNVCNDIESAPLMGPWRKEALGRGYRSLAAFPFAPDTGNAGVITYYASEKGFFTDRIVRLLDEQARDISFALETLDHEEKRIAAEQNLIQSELQYRRLFETAQDAILILDGETGKVIDANKFIIDMLGFPLEYFIGKHLWELGFIRDKSIAQRAFTELKTNGYIRYEDIPLERIDGHIMNVEFISNSYLVGDKRIIQCNIRDITSRKIAERKATVHLAKYKVIFESVPLGLTITDTAGNIVESNRMAEDLLGLPGKDSTGRQIAGKEWHIVRPDGTPMPAEEYASVRALKEQRLVANVEMGLVKGEGVITWIDVTAAPIPLDGYGVAIAYSDISGRKRTDETIRAFGEKLEREVTERTSDLSDVNLRLLTEVAIRIDGEKQLTKSLGEKEVLLREVHHRVKNNLQIIISLLNLQSRYITDGTTLAAFRDSQSRVRAMALVHEKLYRSDNLGTIDFDNYCRFLGENLFQFYGMKGKGVTFKTDIHDISLGIDTAIPLGLIINELISNSLKYGFPDGRSGEISLAIQRSDRTLTILYKDNGVGIPGDVDWRNAKSLGLRLVISLVDQLDGTIELDRSSGTAFTIVVKEKE